MERKLIFLDIDGTLIAALSKPSRLAQEAVQLAQANGHGVCLCTGRNLPSISGDILDMKFDGIVASAGGYVEADGNVLFDSLMPEELVQECLDVFHKNNVFCTLEARDGCYTDPQMEELLKAVSPDPRNSELIRIQKEFESGLHRLRYADYPRQGAYKISFTSADMESIRKAEASLSDRFDFVVHPFLNSGACFNGEIIRKGTDKGYGMKVICQHFGMELKDTIAFGDSMNDYSMLRCAGTGVAMGNACDELKDICDCVCEDVAHDGVYWQLRRMGVFGRLA